MTSTRTTKIALPKSAQITSLVDYDDGYYQKGSPISPRFVDNGDDTITDRVTNLMWTKDDYGWTDFSGALTYAHGLTTGGHTDWRLPNLVELMSITALNFPVVGTDVLLHMDGADGSTTFTDDGTAGLTWTVNDATISTAQGKFNQSGYFQGQDPGTDSYLQANDASYFDWYTQDFTIECWVYPTERYEGVANPTIIANYDYWAFMLQDGTGKIRWESVGAGDCVGNTPVPLNTWSHIAITRQGNQLKMWLNGVLDHDYFIENGNYFMSSNVCIGRNQYGQHLKGWIDELRIGVGAAAYTADFTPPTAPYTTQSPQFIYKYPQFNWNASSTKYVSNTSYPFASNYVYTINAEMSSYLVYVTDKVENFAVRAVRNI